MARPIRRCKMANKTNKKRKGDSDRPLLHDAVDDHAISKDSNVNSILAGMLSAGGFEARNLADGVEILKRMIIEEPKCTKFLSFVAALMSTGARGIIRDLL